MRKLMPGSDEAIPIYQDGLQTMAYGESSTSISRAPMPSVGTQRSPRRPLQNANGNKSVNLPNGQENLQSPRKASRSFNQIRPAVPSYNGKLSLVQMHPPTTNPPITDSMPKKPRKSAPQMSMFRTGTGSFRPANVDKENVPPTLHATSPYGPHPDESMLSSIPDPTRTFDLLEAAPIVEAPVAKPRRPRGKVKTEDDEAWRHDPTKGGPVMYWSEIIYLAIINSEQKKSTLAEIKEFTQEHFWYHIHEKKGWENSVRHNLTMSQGFLSLGRQENTQGKGGDWIIHPGFFRAYPAILGSKYIHEYLPGVTLSPPPQCYTHMEAYIKASPRPLKKETPKRNHKGRRCKRGPTKNPTENLPPLPPESQRQANESPHELAPAPPMSAAEPSSDATILASDDTLPEGPEDRPQEPDTAFHTDMASPLPPALPSSPAMPRVVKRESTTPSSDHVSLQTSRRGQKRKRASLDATAAVNDSGYLSSLSSGAKRPRVKGGKGRAEHEIARLHRGGVTGASPTQSRSHGTIPESSSPLRDSSQSRIPPLTPSFGSNRQPRTPNYHMKPPPRPVTSVSPITDLRAHRSRVEGMIDSPERRASTYSEQYASMAPESPYDFGDLPNENTFMIWAPPYSALNTPTTLNSVNEVSYGFLMDSEGSPIKKSAQRPRTHRPPRASALGDITISELESNGALTSCVPAPSPAALAAYESVSYESPSNALEALPSPSHAYAPSPLPAVRQHSSLAANQENEWTFFDNSYITSFTVPGEEENIFDITQGFDPIGSNSMTPIDNSTMALWQPSGPSQNAD